MRTMFANFDIWIDGDIDDKPFVVACRDRETAIDERWVLASLSVEEAKTVYEYLRKYFENEEES